MKTIRSFLKQLIDPLDALCTHTALHSSEFFHTEEPAPFLISFFSAATPRKRLRSRARACISLALYIYMYKYIYTYTYLTHRVLE